MKKLLNIILIIGIVFSTFSPMIVHGATTTDYVSDSGEYISGIWINREDPARPTWRSWQQAKFIRRASDWMWMYCIQPGVPIDSDLQYNGTDRDWATYANMTQAQWDRVALLSYYGYNYNENGYNHSDSKWYAITQLMIWRIAEPTWDIYWTDSLDGNRVNRYTSEMAELNQLVNEHYKMPSFQNTNQKITIGTSLTLTDSNNILNQYNVSSNSVASASISGNQLTITANSVGNTTLNLTKSTNIWKTPPILYVNPYSQNVMVVGDFDPVATKINIEVIGGKSPSIKKILI